MSARLSAFIHADIAHYERLGRVLDISGGDNIDNDFMGVGFSELADDSGIPSDRIAAICHRTTEPTAMELVRLARALDMAPGELLEELHHDHIEV
jgi:plasmid maintenance system antidote protein VapI